MAVTIMELTFKNHNSDLALSFVERSRLKKNYEALFEEMKYVALFFNHFGKLVKIYSNIETLMVECNYSPTGRDFSDVYYDGTTLHWVPGYELGAGWHEIGHLCAANESQLASRNWTPLQVLASNGEMVDGKSQLYVHTLNNLEMTATRMQLLLMARLCTHKEYIIKCIDYVGYDETDYDELRRAIDPVTLDYDTQHWAQGERHLRMTANEMCAIVAAQI
jgi:hypothetical protein